MTTELQENYTVSIVDASGKQQIIKCFDFLEKSPQISLSELSSGIYVVNFSFANGTFVSRKIVKELLINGWGFVKAAIFTANVDAEIYRHFPLLYTVFLFIL